MAAGHSFELESKLRRLEQNAKTRFGGTTDSELSELEDVVARTAARVQSAESEVSNFCEESCVSLFSSLELFLTLEISCLTLPVSTHLSDLKNILSHLSDFKISWCQFSHLSDLL